MLTFLEIALLLLLSSPWNLIAFLVLLPVWVLELFGWNRTTKRYRKSVGADPSIGREAVVSVPCRPVGQVRLDGEIWEARCEAGAGTGERVRVPGGQRLTLILETVAHPQG